MTMSRDPIERAAREAFDREKGELRAEVERLKAVETAAKTVIDVADRASSSAKVRRLSIMNLRATLADPKP